MEKRYIAGMFGNRENHSELRQKVKTAYTKKTGKFEKADNYDCHIFFWDMPDPERTYFFGYETNGAIVGYQFDTIEIPACEWAIFEVKPSKWWKSGDSEVEGWIANNEKYNWRKYDGSIFQFEYFKEKYKGSRSPDSLMEVWYPLEEKTQYNFGHGKDENMEYEIKLSSVYVFVKNMKRAVDFYEQIFGQKAKGGGTEFYINGIRKFWLFDYKAANDNRANFGHNCLPSFEVSNIKAFMVKLEELNASLVFPLTKIGNNWVLEFKDPEGNDEVKLNKNEVGV